MILSPKIMICIFIVHVEISLHTNFEELLIEIKDLVKIFIVFPSIISRYKKAP